MELEKTVVRTAGLPRLRRVLLLPARPGDGTPLSIARASGNGGRRRTDVSGDPSLFEQKKEK